MKIAIMQPYFIPYAGYFRLFCATDLFVIYDCVQFPRRGFVHRNQLYTAENQLDWLTLPLTKQPMHITIKELMFREQAEEEWHNQLQRFPGMIKIKQKYPSLFSVLLNLNSQPLDYIVRILREICHILEIPFNVKYSSELNLDRDIKGQARILQIAKAYHATNYINSPGGVELYQEKDFLAQQMQLHFLPLYNGEYYSILQALAEQEPSSIKESLVLQSVI